MLKLALFGIVLLQTLCINVNSLKLRNFLSSDVKFTKVNKLIGTISVFSTFTLGMPMINQLQYPANFVAKAADLNGDLSSIENVIRVSYSLKYVTDDIEKGSDAKAVVNEIKLLLQNYKLRDNIQKSLSLLTGSSRDEAKSHGQAAFEDLANVYEYYSDEVDNISGKRTPAPQVLRFALEATNAAKGEFKQYLNCFPSEISNVVNDKLSKEFSI